MLPEVYTLMALANSQRRPSVDFIPAPYPRRDHPTRPTGC
jgi:hypothetical protein